MTTWQRLQLAALTRVIENLEHEVRVAELASEAFVSAHLGIPDGTLYDLADEVRQHLHDAREVLGLAITAARDLRAKDDDIRSRAGMRCDARNGVIVCALDAGHEGGHVFAHASKAAR